MPTADGGDRRQTTRGSSGAGGGGATAEPENLPCPRCESTNTKFCYYNNYNLSQPRYFCKACRRYWTRGGTLRNIPFGGGHRKNSKRPRSSSSVVSASSPIRPLQPPPAPQSSSSAPEVRRNRTPPPPPPEGPEDLVPDTLVNPLGQPVLEAGSVEMNLNEEGIAFAGMSFSSLLGGQGTGNAGGGFLGLNGYGLGGLVSDEMGFGKVEWPMVVDPAAEVDGDGGGVGPGMVCSSTWQLSLGGVDGCIGLSSADGGDCFSWPDLAISTPGKGLE
ncbi:hypothetical protein Dimus_025624 [Dionaea muscipula]